MRNGSKVVDLKAAKQDRDRKQYATLVLSEYDRQEHAEKREFLDRKAEAQIKARERL